MTVTVHVRTNADELTRRLARLRQDQVPYALSRALNTAAKAAQGAVRRELEQRMTLRNRFTERGIQTIPSHKRQWPDVHAYVGIEERRSYLVDHVTGAVRRPRRAEWRAVPTRAVRKTKGGKVRKGQRPYQRLRAGTARVSEDGRALLVNRKRKGTGRLRGLSTLYTLHESVRIRRRLPFVREVHGAARRTLPRELRRELVRAVRSAR